MVLFWTSVSAAVRARQKSAIRKEHRILTSPFTSNTETAQKACTMFNKTRKRRESLIQTQNEGQGIVDRIHRFEVVYVGDDFRPMTPARNSLSEKCGLNILLHHGTGLQTRPVGNSPVAELSRRKVNLGDL